MVQTTRGGSSDFLECVVYKMLSRFFFIFEFGLKGEEALNSLEFPLSFKGQTKVSVLCRRIFNLRRFK